MRVLPVILLALAATPVAFAQEGGVHTTARPDSRPAALAPVNQEPLIIHVPEGANITFEVDIQDDDLLGIIKQLISALGATMNDKTVSLPGPAGAMKVDLAEIKDLFQYIHRIHAVAYETKEGDSKTEAIKHEDSFKKMGLHRMLFMQDKGFVSIMRSDGNGGMAVVIADGNKVMVGRTDGMLNFQVIGKLIGAAIPGFAPGLAPQLAPTTATPIPPKPPAAPKPIVKKPVKKKGR